MNYGEGLRGAYFDSQHVEKDGPANKKCQEDQGEHPQNEPGRALTGLLGRLGDPKRSEKCTGKGFKKSHILRIRAVIGERKGIR